MTRSPLTRSQQNQQSEDNHKQSPGEHEQSRERTGLKEWNDLSTAPGDETVRLQAVRFLDLLRPRRRNCLDGTIGLLSRSNSSFSKAASSCNRLCCLPMRRETRCFGRQTRIPNCVANQEKRENTSPRWRSQLTSSPREQSSSTSAIVQMADEFVKHASSHRRVVHQCDR